MKLLRQNKIYRYYYTNKLLVLIRTECHKCFGRQKEVILKIDPGTDLTSRLVLKTK